MAAGGEAARSILAVCVPGGRISSLRSGWHGPVLLGHGGDLAGRRPRLRYEGGAAVVLQLTNGLVDIGERAVGQALGRLAVVDPRIPAATELFDRAHIDHPVV